MSVVGRPHPLLQFRVLASPDLVIPNGLRCHNRNRETEKLVIDTGCGRLVRARTRNRCLPNTRWNWSPQLGSKFVVLTCGGGEWRQLLTIPHRDSFDSQLGSPPASL
jgi:hypothetical protein